MRPNKKVTSKKNNNKKNGTSHENLVLMRRLIDLQENRAGNFPPRVPDIEMPLFRRDKVHTFTRQIDTTSISAGVADANFAYTFSLGALQDSTEFTTLYDQYRIGVCRVNFVANAGLQPTTISTVIDYDDATTQNKSALGEYSTFQQNQLGNSFFRTLQPRPALAAYSGAFTSFGSAPAKMWMDVASPGILYYGVKGQIPGIAASTTTVVYTVTIEVTIHCRQSR